MKFIQRAAIVTDSRMNDCITLVAIMHSTTLSASAMSYNRVSSARPTTSIGVDFNLALKSYLITLLL